MEISSILKSVFGARKQKPQTSNNGIHKREEHMNAIRSIKSGFSSSKIAIDDMDGPQFERWCADLLTKKGFCRVTVNGKSGDQGVDIFAEKDEIKYAIQCKCYSSDLGNTPIQEVYAGKTLYNCHVAVVMTNRRFTAGGKQLAQSTGVLLWDRDWIERNAETANCSVAPETNPDVCDVLLQDAIDVIFTTQQASVSMIQRQLGIGYARAARLIDEMEALGIVGPFCGSRPRDILITKEQWETMK